MARDGREFGPKAVTCIQPLKFEKVMQVARPEPEIHTSYLAACRPPSPLGAKNHYDESRPDR